MRQPSQKLVNVGILLGTLGFVLVFALVGCNSESESAEHNGESESGEHSRSSEANESSSESESGEHSSESKSGEGGEESGTQFALGDTFDEVRAGVRLVLSYDSAATRLQRHGGEHHDGHTAQGQGRSPPIERNRAGSDYTG